jgi:hypothetical protein
LLAAVDCGLFLATAPAVTGFSSSGLPPCVVAAPPCQVPVPESGIPPPQAAIAAVPLPTETSFHGARPNPFAGTTDLHFSLAAPARVQLTVHDVAGRRVRVLADAGLPAGFHQLPWDGRSDAGGAAASGVYFARFQAGDVLETKRIVLLSGGR